MYAYVPKPFFFFNLRYHSCVVVLHPAHTVSGIYRVYMAVDTETACSQDQIGDLKRFPKIVSFGHITGVSN